MRKAAARRLAFTFSTGSVTRLLISSYFIGLGFGMVEGADITVLARPFLAEPFDGFVTALLVVTLALMVLFGVKRRGAALLLSLVVFWASYLTLVVTAGHEHIGAFWRDLALIGALLLTYSDDQGSLRIDPVRALLTLRNRLGKDSSEEAKAAPKTRVLTTRRPGQGTTSVVIQPKRARTELYRQDFEVVRVS